VAGALATRCRGHRGQRREHRRPRGPSSGHGLPGVRQRGAARRPGGGRPAATPPDRTTRSTRPGRRRQGGAPRLGRPGPGALPPARGTRGAHRGRRRQRLRPPDVASPRHARRCRHRAVPHGRGRHDRGPRDRRRGHGRRRWGPGGHRASWAARGLDGAAPARRRRAGPADRTARTGRVGRRP
jgi:hypothetical protein